MVAPLDLLRNIVLTKCSGLDISLLCGVLCLCVPSILFNGNFCLVALSKIDCAVFAITRYNFDFDKLFNCICISYISCKSERIYTLLTQFFLQD